jgi:TonB family protein
MKHLLAATLVIAAGLVAHAQQVYSPDDAGVSLPKVVRQVKPQYTQEAMQQRIEGTTLLECVVRADGAVADIRVIESLDSTYGLDEQAVKALRQWEFSPGTLDGKPVAVRVHVVMSFTLK